MPWKAAKEVTRVFDRSLSVFADWEEDNEKSQMEAATNDMKHWKVPKICRDEEEYERIVSLVHKHFARLKVIYTNLISQSVDAYPNIGWLQFTNFCKAIDIPSEKCTLSDIERCFIAANYEEEDVPENPNRLLNRYEFLEILVRVADVRYN